MLPYPKISGNRIKLSRSGYLKAGGVALLVFVMIVIYVFQFDHFDKILNPGYFLSFSSILGLILGILIARRYAVKEHEIVEQMRIYVICVVLSIVFMPLFVSLTNRLLDFRTPVYKTAQFLAFKPKTDQPFGYIKGEEVDIKHYRFVLELDGEVFKFSTRELVFPDNRLGDEIEIPVYQGLLGINYLSF